MHLFSKLKNKIAYMKNRKKSVSGFTMAEVLIVVAIMIILFGVGIPAVISYRQKLTLRTLDDKAMTVYTGVQNRLVDMMVTGEESVFLDNDGTINQKMHLNVESGMCVINSNDRNESCVAAIINDKTLEADLCNKGWVVSFNYYTMTVEDVIFYDDESQSVANDLNAIFSVEGIEPFTKSERLSNRASNKEWYGYYGGEGTNLANNPNLSSTKVLNKPYITITNAEIMYADFAFVCSKDTDVSKSKLEICFTDINDKKEKVLNSDAHPQEGAKSAELSQNINDLRTDGWYSKKTRGSYDIYVYHYVIDDLKSNASRFKYKCQSLQPGPVQIDVSIDWTGKGIEEESTSAITNTLFADDNSQTVKKKSVSINKNYGRNKDNAAIITCGRHLQNMDESSGVTGSNNFAYYILKDDIDFTENNDKEGICNWLETYSDKDYFNKKIINNDIEDLKLPNFKPIRNYKLRIFESASTEETIQGKKTVTYSTKKIIGLYEENNRSNASGGLFESVETECEISHINLVYPRIFSVSESDGGKKAFIGTQGALIGKIIAGSDPVNIINCQAYMEESQTGYRFDDSERVNTWGKPLSDNISLMTGKITGGLIGNITSGKVSIKNSSAAINVGSERNDDGSIPVNKNIVGGLIGQIDSSAEVNISQSYSDCYLTGDRVGGLIGNNLSDNTSIKYSYAAGFESYPDSDSASGAGLVLGTNKSDIKWSYNVMYNLYPVTGGTYYATAENPAGIANNFLSSVYYIAPSQGKDSKGNSIDDSKQGLAIGSFTKDGRTVSNLNDEFLTTLNKYFESYDPNKSIKYNFIDGLKSYKYPVLKDIDRHGDWLPEFEEGTLVYYEAYKELNDDGSIKNDTLIYRCNFVEKSDPTKSIKLIDESNYVVVGDGYGLVYTTKPDNNQTIQVSINGMVKVNDNYTETEIVKNTDTNASLTIKNVTPIEVTGTSTYYVYPLDKAISNLDITGNDDNKYSDLQYYYRINVNNGAGGNRSYFFNPHFADTVEEDPAAELGKQSAIPVLSKNVRIRTPRHLYMLSLYYDKYRDAIGQLTVKQERNIDYALYDWTNYLDKKVDININSTGNVEYTKTALAAGERIIEQSPIACLEAKPFIAKYDGQYNWITNVSFSSKNADYVGFVGNNAGFISNMILRASYDKDDESKQKYYVKRLGNIEAGHPVYMGIVAGLNGKTGVISNCAVAGYYISGSDGTIHAYENSTLYAGGLVGQNNGAITDCASDSPTLRLSSTYANASIGGFVGNNTAYITNCYALGSIEVADSKGGKVVAAGFAGNNSQTGEIVRSYCATAILTSGETAYKYGFAPLGGKVDKCEYLNKGTFSYIRRTYPFDFNKTISSATSVTYQDLVKEASGDKAEENAAKHSYEFKNTKTSSEKYPFRAVVRNEKKELVHYGDWFDDENMGIAGVFYWEHEVGGKNDGYHFTYLGIENDSLIGGSSLCTAHDDGGVITEYGYGYYELTEGTVERVELSGIDIKDSTTVDSKKCITYEDNIKNKTDNKYYNNDASKELSDQVHKNVDGQTISYNFYAFTTRLPDDANGEEYIYLNSNRYNGSMKLVFRENKYTSREYAVSPFFANAIQVPYGVSGSAEITAYDGTKTNYKKVPGFSTNNKYEIRSVKQLQYINWSWNESEKKGSVANLPTKDNNQNFNYLLYSDTDGQHKMTRYESGVGHLEDKYWSQSHDLDATKYANFTPIAGLSTHSGVYNDARYAADLYAWFGDSYDGRSYKIKNINISSKSYAVGLFGVCAGANIENVIMYSDNNSVIQRNTDASDEEGAYALGGMIGIAYDYARSSGLTDGMELLANFDFEGLTAGEDIVTPLARASTNNSYSLVDGTNGKALRLRSANNQFLSLTDAEGNPLLKGCSEVLVSADVSFERDATDWLFFAAPSNDTQSYQNERYLGILHNGGRVTAEKYYNTGSRPDSLSHTYATNSKHNLTVKYADNATIMYIDGVEVERDALEKNINNIVGDNGIVYIGRANWITGGEYEYSNITIDNLRIYGKRSNSSQALSSTNEIKNCAIAGYRIVDNSKNKQTEGEANIGGLIGVSNINLNGCSAVVDTEINCTHYDTDKTGLPAASGNYIRVGGLTGANKNEIVNCYTGGSISVGSDALYETFDDDNKLIASNKAEFDKLTGTLNRSKNTHIFVGGITGSGFTETFRNFDNTNSYVDGTPKLFNCYTYIDLPEMTGNIRVVSVLGSVADRFAFGDASIYFNNCYYLNSSAKLAYSNLPKYKFADVSTLTKAVMEARSTENNPNNLQNWQKMMYGSVSFLADYYWEKNRNPKSRVTYSCFVGLDREQMLNNTVNITVNNGPFDKWSWTQNYDSFAAALNYRNNNNVGDGVKRTGNWTYVTSREGDNDVHGKYSFANNAALTGKDYPFPTIVTQSDRLGGSSEKINVHYGDWPPDGAYWRNGRSEMDIFGDMQRSGDYDGLAVKSFYIKPDSKSTSAFSLNDDGYNFKFSNEDIANVISVGDSPVSDGVYEGFYEVKIKAKNVGYTTVTLTDKGVNTSATFTLQVKAEDLTIVKELKDDIGNYTAIDNLVLSVDALKNIYLFAANSVDNDDMPVNPYADSLIEWKVTPEDENLIKTKETDSKNCWEVKRVAEGDSKVNITMKYKYKYGDTDDDVNYITISDKLSVAAAVNHMMLLNDYGNEDILNDSNVANNNAVNNANNKLNINQIEDEQYRAYIEGMAEAGNLEVNDIYNEDLDGH